jgi:hypothetical protein
MIFDDGILKYELHENLSATVLGFIKEEETVEIPYEIYLETDGRTYQVQKIAPQAFQRNKTVKSVNLPFCLIEIGEYAFAESSIKTIKRDFYAKDVNVGSYAFFNCRQLKTVALKNMNVGISTFEKCVALTEIDSDYILNLNAKAFSGCISLKEFTISDNLEIIPDDAFENCLFHKVVFCVYSKCDVPNGMISTLKNATVHCTSESPARKLKAKGIRVEFSLDWMLDED